MIEIFNQIKQRNLFSVFVYFIREIFSLLYRWEKINDIRYVYPLHVSFSFLVLHYFLRTFLFLSLFQYATNKSTFSLTYMSTLDIFSFKFHSNLRDFYEKKSLNSSNGKWWRFLSDSIEQVNLLEKQLLIWSDHLVIIPIIASIEDLINKRILFMSISFR